MEFSIHGFPVQKQSHDLLKNTNVSWKQMCFPFDFPLGGNFSLVLSDFPGLVLVDRMFHPHCHPPTPFPSSNALADLVSIPAL